MREEGEGHRDPGGRGRYRESQRPRYLDVARKQLEYMVHQGDLELHASESGVPPLVYVVPEFLTDATRSQIAGY